MDQGRDRRERPVATIRASCPTCGDVELTSRDVTVRVCAADSQGSYAFRCPTCALAVSKRADPDAGGHLAALDVEFPLAGDQLHG